MTAVIVDSATELFAGGFNALVEHDLDDAPVLSDLRAGRLPDGDLRKIVLRHTAEVRTALDLKIPARLLLCPTDAFAAKKFLTRLYSEEQGEFVSERNHANLMAAFARSIGITDEEMLEEYEKYSAHYASMLTEKPSYEALVRELTIACVWEGVILRLGTDYLGVIQAKFGLPEGGLEYFDVHREDDEHHSAAALKVLAEYVRDEDIDLVRATIRETLVDRNPWALP